MLAALWLLACLRVAVLWAHDPLLAYANSYDQTRYTSCFQMYPDRPAGIPPQQNSPEAPFAKYRFIATGDPMCYWSSELLFSGAAALVWRVGEALGGGEVHDVRLVGALRWLTLFGLSMALSLAWLRHGEPRIAIAHAALLPLLFADPGNTLYLDTFYAEWSALLAAYALCALAQLWHDAPRSRRRFALLALAAFALAAAKIQHLVLPLGLAAVVLVFDRLRLGRVSWRAVAILLGAFGGFWLQFVQLQREGPMMDAIDQYNRADVVFTALLPFADDRGALLTELGIDPQCAIYSGHRAWQFPDMPERICAGLARFDRGTELATLLRHPRIALRLAGHGVLGLDPWIAQNLGVIEGREFATLPAQQPSIGPVLQSHPWLRWTMLALPLLGGLVLLVTHQQRQRSRALEGTALVGVIMLGTLTVAVLGDGLADVAKQGHLVVNAALAWLILVVLIWLPGWRPRSG
jgi:hypothetical protein